MSKYCILIGEKKKKNEERSCLFNKATIPLFQSSKKKVSPNDILP